MTTVSLEDLLLRPGDIARATGSFERIGEGLADLRLWVELNVKTSGVRMEGGHIGVALQPGLPDVDLLDPAARVTVDGRWNGQSLEQASYRLVTEPQRMPTVRGPDLPSPYGYSDEEYAGFGAEMWRAADSVGLATGGSEDALVVQLLYVTERFLQWYRDFSATRVDVDVSVYPV